MNNPIKIGTRGSKLALWQANWVKSVLEKKFPPTAIELIIIKTQGDKILDVPLAKVGGKGLFVKEIEQALLTRRIDIAVHSMKDMPADIPEGLCIGAIPERENPVDVFISRNGAQFTELAAGSSPDKAQRIAFRAALIPVINSLFAVGLVSLPGMMTGQILSGTSPLVAAKYQIVVMSMLFGVSGMSAAIFLHLERGELERLTTGDSHIDSK